MSGVRSIAFNTGYLTAARIAAQITRLIYIALVARALGPDLYGFFVYGQSVYLLLMSLAALGLGRVLAIEVGKDRFHGQTLVGQALSLRAISAAVAALLCVTIGSLGESEPVLRMLLVIFGVALFGRAIAMWAEETLIAYETTRLVVWQETLFRPLELLAAVLVLAIGGGIIALAMLHATTWLLQGLRGLYIVNRRLVSLSVGLRKPSVWLLLSRGFPLGLSGILTAWLLQGPIILYRHHTPDAASVGQLGLTMQTLTILTVLAWSLAAASLPVLSRSVARGDGKDRLFAAVVSGTGWLAGASLALGGLAFGPWLVVGIFGPNYADAGVFLGPVLALFAPLFIGLASSTVLVAHGRRVSTLLHAAAAAITLWALMPGLTQAFGAKGAILGAGAASGLWAVTQSIELRYLGIVKLWRSLLCPAVAGVISLSAYASSASEFGPTVGFGLGILILGLLGTPCLSRAVRRALWAWRA